MCFWLQREAHFFFSFQWFLMDFKTLLYDLLMIFGRFVQIFWWCFHDFFQDLFMIWMSGHVPSRLPTFFASSWFIGDFSSIFLIDFLSSEGRSPEARRRSHAEVAGKAVSFLLRIPYIFQNFPLLSFCSPRFPFLLLQVSEYCFSLQPQAHFREFRFRVTG